MPPIQREKLPVIIKSLYGMFRNDPMDKRIYGIPVHEQMILLWSNVPGFFFRSGPLKSSHLQPLIFLWISSSAFLHYEPIWLCYFNKATFHKQGFFYFAVPVIIRISWKLVLCTIVFDRQYWFIAVLDNSSSVFYADLCCDKFSVHGWPPSVKNGKSILYNFFNIILNLEEQG